MNNHNISKYFGLMGIVILAALAFTALLVLLFAFAHS